MVDEPVPVIRDGKRQDSGFIRDLARSAFSRFGEYDRILPEWFEEPGVITAIAEKQNKPVGFAMLRFNRNWLGQGALAAELLAIAVIPEQQRKGIGHLLLEYLESVAKEHGASLIHLHTAEDNFAAQTFFAKSGFTMILKEEGYYPAGQRAILMAKSLD